MSFLNDVMAFEKKALLAASNSTGKIANDMFTEPVLRSPSGPKASHSADHSNGVLINQWYPVIGSTADTYFDNTADKNGSGSLSRIDGLFATQPFLGKDNVLTMSNNTPQAYHAEVIGWPAGKGTNGWYWSGNAQRYFMVRNSIPYILGKYT